MNKKNKELACYLINMPNIKGSSRQYKWAKEIRSSLVQTLIRSGEDQKIIDEVANVTDAKVWLLFRSEPEVIVALIKQGIDPKVPKGKIFRCLNDDYIVDYVKSGKRFYQWLIEDYLSEWVKRSEGNMTIDDVLIHFMNDANVTISDIEKAA